MSRRDSDSKRRHYKFDREPSPKRYRRDGKQERERDRVTSGANQENRDNVDRDQRNRRQLHDTLPHESPLADQCKQETVAVNNNTDKNPNDRYEALKHSSDSTHAPRSHSHFQHEERGSTRQDGRSTGQRRADERGRSKDSKDQHNGRVETTHSRKLGDEKSQAKLGDNSQRRDCFPERRDDPPPTVRKRPAFREKKIPVDSGDANPAPTVPAKSSQNDHPPERNERREEKSDNPGHLDRPEKHFVQDREPFKNEARRDGFSSREYGGSGGNSNYRRRDKFNERQGYHPSKTRAEKWKHDLYQEVNKDPISKNEDDQIAKLEALLAS